MPVSLLESQISILEEPEEYLVIDATIEKKIKSNHKKYFQYLVKS